MLAARLPGLLPDLLPRELLEVSMVRSLAGELTEAGLGVERPFRAPHHSASMAALCGGGTRPRPGEVALAHRGVLFLDELPEFQPNVLDALRQPLETRAIAVARANHRIEYPADFQLIAAMNPCKCGQWAPGMTCRAGRACRDRYIARLSGPLLDRMDLTIAVSALSIKELQSRTPSETSSDVRRRVSEARDLQLKRYQALQSGGDPSKLAGATNASISQAVLERIHAADDAALDLLRRGAERFALTARGYHRCLRVARTIADLERSPRIQRHHVAEALGYRSNAHLGPEAPATWGRNARDEQREAEVAA